MVPSGWIGCSQSREYAAGASHRQRRTSARWPLGAGPAVGLPAVFLAAGDYHHHIGLNTFEGAGASPPPPGHTGLYHFALLYPDRPTLARAVARLKQHGVKVRGVDHGGTVSVYLEDPDRNGIELYYDRPRSEWYDAAGRPVVKAAPFDVGELLADMDPALAGPRPPGDS
jgi:catechol 2,3-dioxygenase